MRASTPGHFEQVEGWEQLPAGMRHEEVGDVAVDANDRVYLLGRRDNRVLVHERDGTFVRSWGESVISDGAHGIGVAPDLSVYVVNFFEHTVSHFSPDGELVGMLGTPGVASDTGIDTSLPYLGRLAGMRHAAGPFNGPTQVRFGPDGSFFVSDGYGNARIHRFSPDGELITSWGDPGSGPGEFRNPHDIDVDEEGNVFVADRENERVQIFDPGGALLDVWPNLRRASGIAARGGLVAVAHLEWRAGETPYGGERCEETQEAFISILDRTGSVVCTIHNDPESAHNLAAPNGAAFDSRGDLYVAGVPWTFFGRAADPAMAAGMPARLGVPSEYAAGWAASHRPDWPPLLKFRRRR